MHKDNATEFSYDHSTTVNKITDNRRANVPRLLSRSIGRLPSLEIFQDLHLRVGVKSEVKLSPREIHYRVLGICGSRGSQHCEQPDKQTTLIYRCNCRILCKSTFGFPQTTVNCQQLCSLKLRRRLVSHEKIPVSETSLSHFIRRMFVYRLQLIHFPLICIKLCKWSIGNHWSRTVDFTDLFINTRITNYQPLRIFNTHVTIKRFVTKINRRWSWGFHGFHCHWINKCIL